jgi:uncharacterized membrane protein
MTHTMRRLPEGMKQYKRVLDYIAHVQTIINYECEKCGTRYPVIEGKMMCNGNKILDCPYCIKKEEANGEAVGS